MKENQTITFGAGSTRNYPSDKLPENFPPTVDKDTTLYDVFYRFWNITDHPELFDYLQACVNIYRRANQIDNPQRSKAYVNHADEYLKSVNALKPGMTAAELDQRLYAIFANYQHDFLPVPSSSAIKEIRKATNKRNVAINDEVGKLETKPNGRNDFKATFETDITKEAVDFFLSTLTVSTLKVMYFVMSKFKAAIPGSLNPEDANAISQIDAARAVTISVSEVMDTFKIKDVKHAREIIKNAVIVMDSATIYYTEENFYTNKTSKKGKKYMKADSGKVLSFHIGGGMNATNLFKNGYATIYLDMNFAKYLTFSTYALMIQTSIYSLPSKSSCFPLALYIKECTNNFTQKKKPYILKVTSLLENAPTIPNYETVMKSNRHVDDRIIKPLIRDLDTLSENQISLSYWEFCNRKGEPLTDEQLNSYSYEEFKTWRVKYTPVKEPSFPELVDPKKNA